KIEKTQGVYQPVATRNNIIEIVSDKPAKSVKMNGKQLSVITSIEQFIKRDEGFINLPRGILKCKSGLVDIHQTKTFTVNLTGL
ncbi:MAG: hypothetical protein ABJA79_06740, partial [Parafilimonas sp.]